MAYTTIKKPSDYFNTVLYTGNGSTQSITGVGFQPDWVWMKKRNVAAYHQLLDSVRGVTKGIFSNATNAETIQSDSLTSFDSDGFTADGFNGTNASGGTYVAWNWLAAGTAPSKTYTVKVVDDSGNKYRFDDFGTSAVTLEISEGGTFRFDQADSSNSGHPLRFSTTSDGTHGGGSEYTTGVTTVGTPGSAGAYTEITVAASAPTLYYYCSAHSGMGGQANTPTTNSFSDFSGSIQSNISPNTTSGFSIVSYDGNNGTIGHGLGVAPNFIIVKRRNGAEAWAVGCDAIGWGNRLTLDTTAASASASTTWNSTAPTSSVFSVGTNARVNGDSIAYCFADVKGFSKFGSYTGNGNADGTFIYTGFKPAFIIVKKTNATFNWIMYDNKRDELNPNTATLLPDDSGAEYNIGRDIDFLSNGFKMRANYSGNNNSGDSYIYMCFAEEPLVGDNPATAR